MAAANPDLPEAILLEIFSRLPAKSVGRCRCLSKSWRRELSTTHFINKHLVTRQQTIKQQNVALVTECDEFHIVTSPLKNDEQVKMWMWTGFLDKMLGACNGLVLLKGEAEYEIKDGGFSVMNPITLEQVNVPLPDPAWDDNLSDVSSDYDENVWYDSVYGFGYDCYGDDYKVIALQFSHPVDIDIEAPKSVTLVDVYSLKRAVWYSLDSNIYPYGDLIPLLSLWANGAFVNGSLHWFICETKSGVYCHIAAFDLAKEVFHDIPIPADFAKEVLFMVDLSGLAIHVIGGCLSIVHHIGGPNTVNASSCGGTDVWMMKEYGVAESWVRFHIAGLEYGLSPVPVCMVGDEQLMCHTGTEALVVCDLKDGTTKNVIVCGEETWYEGGIAFVDSLVSPGKLMAANPDLPEAIMLEIFSRLPAKSVGRCRCLSKSWRRELSTTHFINKHLITRQQTIKHENVALITEYDELHFVTSPLKNDEQFNQMWMWTGVLDKRQSPLGACNGLVLLKGDTEYENKDGGFSVMNPITFQQVNVPLPDPAWDDNLSDVSDYDNVWYDSVYGFGYDCYTDDFKVIALQFFYPVDIDIEAPKSVTLVDVYSLKRGVWDSLDSNIYPYGHLIPLLSRHRNGAFVNGSLHWFICETKSGLYCHIAAFDLAKEVFHDIPIPADFAKEVLFMVDLSGLAIHVIGGCLSIVHHIGGPNTVNASSCGGTDVWMMKEYGVAESWVRFHIAGLEYGLSPVPVCMVGDEQLMCHTGTEALVVCDLKGGTTKSVIVCGEETWYAGGIAFVDSLVSPGKCECDN